MEGFRGGRIVACHGVSIVGLDLDLASQRAGDPSGNVVNGGPEGLTSLLVEPPGQFPSDGTLQG